MSTTTTKWWQGTNFYIAAAMVIGGIWAGLQEQDVKNAVMGIFGTISALGLLREKIKGPKISVSEWLSSRNTWNYFGVAIMQLVPTIPADLFTRVNEAFTALLSKNWTGFISAILSSATIVYFWLRAQPASTTAKR